MKEGQVITKQLLLAFCLCSKCRFQLYSWNRFIYIVDSVSRLTYYIAQIDNKKLYRSPLSYSHIITTNKITAIDELIILMNDGAYNYFD